MKVLFSIRLKSTLKHNSSIAIMRFRLIQKNGFFIIEWYHPTFKRYFPFNQKFEHLSSASIVLERRIQDIFDKSLFPYMNLLVPYYEK